jgi:hypothetical protein
MALSSLVHHHAEHKPSPSSANAMVRVENKRKSRDQEAATGHKAVAVSCFEFAVVRAATNGLIARTHDERRQ